MGDTVGPTTLTKVPALQPVRSLLFTRASPRKCMRYGVPIPRDHNGAASLSQRWDTSPYYGTTAGELAKFVELTGRPRNFRALLVGFPRRNAKAAVLVKRSTSVGLKTTQRPTAKDTCRSVGADPRERCRAGHGPSLNGPSLIGPRAVRTLRVIAGLSVSGPVCACCPKPCQCERKFAAPHPPCAACCRQDQFAPGAVSSYKRAGAAAPSAAPKNGCRLFRITDIIPFYS